MALDKQKKAGKPISAFLLYLESNILTSQSMSGLTYTVSGLPIGVYFDSASYSFNGVIHENDEKEINITVEGLNDSGTLIKETFIMRLIELENVPFVLLLHMNLEKWISEKISKMAKIFSRNSNQNKNLAR